MSPIVQPHDASMRCGRAERVDHAVANAFGFGFGCGGINASLVLGRGAPE